MEVRQILIGHWLRFFSGFGKNILRVRERLAGSRARVGWGRDGLCGEEGGGEELGPCGVG
jgi:hypothetical protein